MNLRVSLSSLLAALLTIAAPSVSLAQGLFGASNSPSLFSVQPKAFVGYMFPSGPATILLDTSGGFQIRRLHQSFNVQGLWTELVVPIQCPSPLGFAIGFGYLFPNNCRSQETYNTSGGTAERTWSTSTQMVNFQVGVTYRILPSITGILGFRYDSFMTTFRAPENEVPNVLKFTDRKSADLTVSADLPFIGVMLERDVAYGLNIKAGAIGLPTLPGQIDYREVVGTDQTTPGDVVFFPREFSSGYFMEGFAELSLPIYSWAKVGAFANYSTIHGKASNGNIDYTTAKTAAPGQSANASYGGDLILERSNWIVGGSLSVDFGFYF